MNTPSGLDELASFLAEEILRKIYGDDYKGCNTSPAEVAEFIQRTLSEHQKETAELIDLYAKVIEAIDLLSTPPDSKSVKDVDELRKLLSERLDDIHGVTGKTISTIASVRSKKQAPE